MKIRGTWRKGKRKQSLEGSSETLSRNAGNINSRGDTKARRSPLKESESNRKMIDLTTNWRNSKKLEKGSQQEQMGDPGICSGGGTFARCSLTTLVKEIGKGSAEEIAFREVNTAGMFREGSPAGRSLWGNPNEPCLGAEINQLAKQGGYEIGPTQMSGHPDGRRPLPLVSTMYDPPLEGVWISTSPHGLESRCRQLDMAVFRCQSEKRFLTGKNEKAKA